MSVVIIEKIFVLDIYIDVFLSFCATPYKYLQVIEIIFFVFLFKFNNFLFRERNRENMAPYSQKHIFLDN